MSSRFNQRTFIWLLLVVTVLVVISIHSIEARTKSSKHSIEKEKEEEETTKSPKGGSGGSDEGGGAREEVDDAEDKEGGEEKDKKDAKGSSKGSRASGSMNHSKEKESEDDADMEDKGDSIEGAGGATKKSNGSSRKSDSDGGYSDMESDSEEDGAAKKPSKGSRTTDSMRGDSDEGDSRKGESEMGEGSEEKGDESSEGGGKQQASKGSRAGAIRTSKAMSIVDLKESDIADEGDRRALLGRPRPPLTRGRSRTGLSEDSKHKASKKGARNNGEEDGEKSEDDEDEGKGSRTSSQDNDMTSSDESMKKESEEGGSHKPSYRKGEGSRSSTGTTKKPKSKKSKKKGTEGEEDDNDESELDTEGATRISGGWAVKDSDPPGWITQVREDRSGTFAGGCQYAHLLGFALRLADEFLLMHDRTFKNMNRENEQGGLGTRPGNCPGCWQVKGAHDFVMMPIQHPVPRKINVGGLGKLGTKDCMYKMGFRMEKWDQKEDNVSIYKYERQGHVAAFQYEETFDYPMIEKDPLAPIYNCELLGWSEYVEGQENVEGTWDFEFARLPLKLEKCDAGQKHCEFTGRDSNYKAAICTNDIGLPIVCGKSPDEMWVRFIVGEPLPFGRCAEVPIRAYNVAHLLQTGAQGDVEWKNKDEVEVMVYGTRKPKTTRTPESG